MAVPRRYEVTRADSEAEISLHALVAADREAIRIQDGLLVIGSLGTSAAYRFTSFDPGRLVFICELVDIDGLNGETREGAE
jgi:hypothetical protein